MYRGFAWFFDADLSRGVPDFNKSTWIGIQAMYEMRDLDSEMRHEGRGEKFPGMGFPGRENVPRPRRRLINYFDTK